MILEKYDYIQLLVRNFGGAYEEAWLLAKIAMGRAYELFGWTIFDDRIADDVT